MSETHGVYQTQNEAESAVNKLQLDGYDVYPIMIGETGEWEVRSGPLSDTSPRLARTAIHVDPVAWEEYKRVAGRRGISRPEAVRRFVQQEIDAARKWLDEDQHDCRN